MVALVRGLVHRGHSVELFLYYPEQDFFRPAINSSGIPVHEFDKRNESSYSITKALIKCIRTGKFDVVLSYLTTPNIYAEIAGLFSTGSKFVVSERSSHLGDRGIVRALASRALHVLADHVVANSLTHTSWLSAKWWLAGRVSCIYNGLEVPDRPAKGNWSQGLAELKLLAVGRIGPEKNILNLVRGLDLLYARHGTVPEVVWVGRQDPSAASLAYRAQVDAFLEARPQVASRWKWLGERMDVPELMVASHALVHPALYEGLPNVVCEAMAVGRAVLVSDVCDHPALVKDGERGFLFNPQEPNDIARAIERLSGLDVDEWSVVGCNAHEFARQNLSVENMVSSYEALFGKLTKVIQGA